MTKYANVFFYSTLDRPVIETGANFDSRADCLDDITEDTDRVYLRTIVLDEDDRVEVVDLEREAFDMAADAIRAGVEEMKDQDHEMWRRTG